MTDASAHAGQGARGVLTIAAVLLATALYTLLALSSGLDRIAADRGLPGPVVWPFGAGHARAASKAALIGDAPADARVHAREAVRRDPLDAEAMGLLGAAALRSGNAAEAARAFDVAARLGWREPLAQAYWFNTALAHGDYRRAADHLDAILRQEPGFAGRNLLLAPFDASPTGRRELATRLLAHPAWAAAYFGDTAAAEAGDPQARAEVAVLLAREHRVRDCALVAPVIDGLVRHDHYGQALWLHTLHCAGTSPGTVMAPVDGQFARADPAHPRTVLDWHFADDGAIDLALATRPGIPGRAAVVANASSTTLAFAEQPTALNPAGRTVISWRARDADGTPSPAIEVAFSCGPGQAAWLPKLLVDRGSACFEAVATVPAGCSMQRLTLGIAGGANDIAVGDVRVVSRGM